MGDFLVAEFDEESPIVIYRRDDDSPPGEWFATLSYRPQEPHLEWTWQDRQGQGAAPVAVALQTLWYALDERTREALREKLAALVVRIRTDAKTIATASELLEREALHPPPPPDPGDVVPW